MRAAAIALVALLAGCKTPEPPGSFGVDLTITLDGASRAGLAQVLINVSGAEEYAATLPASAFPDGTGQLHYIPGAHSGTISIGATAQDGAGAKLGAGNSGPITLTDGRSVAATLAVTMGGSSSGDGGTDDMGSGLKALGAMCGFDSDCDSGHCVDGFCCGVATCGQCENCGATGMCAAVTNKDDNSAPTCNGQKSCDSSGICKDRWVVAKTLAAYTFAPGGQANGIGNLIFLEGHSVQTPPPPITPTYVFDTTNSSLVIQNGGNSDICNCGAASYMFPAGTEVCEFGNTASCIDSAAASPRSWGSAIAGYTIRSDGAWASVGTKIYGTGGNSNDKTLSIYDTVGNTWTTGPDAPFGLTFAAGGATSNQFFVVGQTPINTTVFIAFTPSMNAWAQLAMPPSGIYREYMPQWSNKLVAKTSSTLRTFDLTSMTWDPLPIPLPTGIGTSEAVVVVAGTPATLFIIGDDATSTMNIFKYNL